MSGSASGSNSVGLLISGGLDSCILLGHLLERGAVVQPFYLRTGVSWQSAEESAVERYLAAMAGPGLRPLVPLSLPLADLYESHWSITGKRVPSSDSPDEAVYLPGRNALLLVKPVVWCQLHGVGRLLWAPLGTSPFEDASPAFVAHFEDSLNRGAPARVTIELPFRHFNKQQVMQLGKSFPLELTFSCIAPRAGRHCGRCNKCAERQQAFHDAGLPDPTDYAADLPRARSACLT